MFQNRTNSKEKQFKTIKDVMKLNKKHKKSIPSDKFVNKKLEIYQNKTNKLYQQVIDNNIRDFNPKYMAIYENMKRDNIKIEMKVEID
jgi:hypothetical protein